RRRRAHGGEPGHARRGAAGDGQGTDPERHGSAGRAPRASQADGPASRHPDPDRRTSGVVTPMPANVKVMKRPVRKSSYIRATLQGMALTFRHMTRAAGDRSKLTLQYPDERKELSPRWRGTHVMEKHEDGRPKCVACGLCPTVCPANCIKLVPGEDDAGNRYPI